MAVLKSPLLFILLISFGVNLYLLSARVSLDKDQKTPQTPQTQTQRERLKYPKFGPKSFIVPTKEAGYCQIPHHKQSYKPVRHRLPVETPSITDLTIILVALSKKEVEEAINAIKTIRAMYPQSRVVFGCIDACEKLGAEDNVHVEQLESSTTIGRGWNILISKATTKYVFIVSPKTRFTEHSKLDPIFKGFSWTNATFISGSIRYSDTDEVLMPCFRMIYRRWSLKNKYGYEYSLTNRNDPPCVVCGRTALPLIAKREKILEMGGFDEELHVGVLTEFFLRARKYHYGSMVCPNTMFEITKHEELEDPSEALFPLAKKIKVDNILQHDGKRIWMCREDWTLAFHHQLWMGGGLFSPLCNYKQYMSFGKDVIKVLEDNNLRYKLSGGDMLGALKFRKYLPWDGDFDIYLEATHDQFRNLLLPIFEKRGYHVEKVTYNQYNLKPTKWGAKFDQLGNDVLVTLGLDPRFPAKTSRHRYGDYFVNVDYNPFDYALKTYGNKFFEHHFHNSLGGGRLYCKKENYDIWFDYGGKGTGPVPKIVSQEGHNACLPDFRETGGGTFLPWEE